MIRIALAPLLALAAAVPPQAQPQPQPQPQPTQAVPSRPTSAAAAPVAAHPALWKVTSPTATVWLFGTIHALPEGYAWRDAAIDGAVGQAQALVIETLLDKDPVKSAELFYGLARSPGLPPLVERVRPADRPRLQALLAHGPLPAAQLDGLETWAAALVLTGITLTDLGISAQAGVERGIEDSFEAAHKPVSGLETPAQQLGFLDTLPEDEQRRFLEEMLDDPQETRAEYAAMMKAWAAGDEAAIARSFDTEAKVSPLLRTILITRRNAAWAEWIAARLAQPGALLVAVGAGHLAGPGSVQALLKAKGFTVTRVQ